MKHGWYIYTQQLGGGTVRLAGRSTGWRRGTRLANTDFLDTRHNTNIKKQNVSYIRAVMCLWRDFSCPPPLQLFAISYSKLIPTTSLMWGDRSSSRLPSPTSVLQVHMVLNVCTRVPRPDLIGSV